MKRIISVVVLLFCAAVAWANPALSDEDMKLIHDVTWAQLRGSSQIILQFYNGSTLLGSKVAGTLAIACDGTTTTCTYSGNKLTITSAAGGATPFNSITSGTNTTAAMVCGSGCSLAVPTQAVSDNSTNAASTAFVQSAVIASNPAVAVQAATTSAANTSGLTYNNGVGGIGATFTGTNNTALTVDGFTFTALGQRLLVKNDTQSPSGAFNGVYYVTQLQAALLPPILTRALDYDMPSDINNTGLIPVINGTVNATTAWLLTSQVNTVGTDPLTYTQFSSGSGTVNSGTAPQLAYYASNGTAISSLGFSDLELIGGGRMTAIVQDGSNSTPATLVGIVALTGVGASFTSSVATATDPPYRTTTTAATTNSNVGISTDRTTYFSSTASPRIQFIGKSSATATVREFWCLSDQSIATLGGSATPAGNSACIRYDTSASDTNFMCGSSAAGTWTFTSTGVAADTNVHTFTVLINGTSNVTCYVDGLHPTVVSTHVMASGTTLGWTESLTTLANSAVGLSYSSVRTRSTF